MLGLHVDSHMYCNIPAQVGLGGPVRKHKLLHPCRQIKEANTSRTFQFSFQIFKYLQSLVGTLRYLNHTIECAYTSLVDIFSNSRIWIIDCGWKFSEHLALMKVSNSAVEHAHA